MVTPLNSYLDHPTWLSGCGVGSLHSWGAAVDVQRRRLYRNGGDYLERYDRTDCPYPRADADPAAIGFINSGFFGPFTGSVFDHPDHGWRIVAAVV